MPTISISPDLHFFYYDSGAPNVPNYETVVIIHGHTFHGATFKPLFAPALKSNMRIILINRRGYPHSSPFTPREMDIMTSPTSILSDKETLSQEHGANLSLFLDKLVSQAELPEGRNVTVAGWSNGGIWALGVMAYLNTNGDGGDYALSDVKEVRERLRKKIKRVVLWDPPSVCFGVPPPPGTYIPLFDESIPVEERGEVFALWVASYFSHPSISSHCISDLTQRVPLSIPPPSTTRMSEAQMADITDPLGGGEWDTPIGSERFVEVHGKQAMKALFGSRLRRGGSVNVNSKDGMGSGDNDGGNDGGNDDEDDDEIDVCVLVGDANTWVVIYGMWVLEEIKSKKSDDEGMGRKLEVGFKIMHGANHFVFWDNPNATVDVLRECVEGNMTSVIVEPVGTAVENKQM